MIVLRYMVILYIYRYTLLRNSIQRYTLLRNGL